MNTHGSGSHGADSRASVWAVRANERDTHILFSGVFWLSLEKYNIYSIGETHENICSTEAHSNPWFGVDNKSFEMPSSILVGSIAATVTKSILYLIHSGIVYGSKCMARCVCVCVIHAYNRFCFAHTWWYYENSANNSGNIWKTFSLFPYIKRFQLKSWLLEIHTLYRLWEN